MQACPGGSDEDGEMKKTYPSEDKPPLCLEPIDGLRRERESGKDNRSDFVKPSVGLQVNG